jgi:hypothetical protein
MSQWHPIRRAIQEAGEPIRRLGNLYHMFPLFARFLRVQFRLASHGPSFHASSGRREAAVRENDLQNRNARLRRKIDGALKTRPELEAAINGIALKQPANASLEQVQANLQERARAIIEAKPELDGYFDL